MLLARAPSAADDAALAAELAPGAAAAPSRADLFHRWLQRQRERGGSSPTPGLRWQQAESALSRLAWLLGLAAGAGLAAAWLAGSGTEPVNAPLFWAVTVGLQLVLLLLALAGWAGRRRLARAAGGLQSLLRAALAAAAGASRHAAGQTRDEVRAVLGLLAQRRDAIGHLFALPAVAISQRFGVAFNLGLLGAMLALHLPLVDLRFGWQSSYPVTPAQVKQAVDAVAAPWRWALPQAQPTEGAVAATRYSRGQAAERLPPQAGRAWWPFLALSIAVYGLLVRSALLAATRLMLRRGLASLSFDHPEANALWRRLTGPLVQVQGGAAELPAAVPATAPRAHAGGRCIVLRAVELVVDDGPLAEAVMRRFGWAVDASLAVTIDDRAAAAPTLALAAAQTSAAAWLVVVSADRDPIVAVGLFLRATRCSGRQHVRAAPWRGPPPATRRPRPGPAPAAR